MLINGRECDKRNEYVSFRAQLEIKVNGISPAREQMVSRFLRDIENMVNDYVEMACDADDNMVEIVDANQTDDDCAAIMALDFIDATKLILNSAETAPIDRVRELRELYDNDD